MEAKREMRREEAAWRAQSEAYGSRRNRRAASIESAASIGGYSHEVNTNRNTMRIIGVARKYNANLTAKRNRKWHENDVMA